MISRREFAKISPAPNVTENMRTTGKLHHDDPPSIILFKLAAFSGVTGLYPSREI